MEKRLPRIFVNRVSLFGALLATVSLFVVIFLSVVELFAKQTHPYMGMITFIVVPGFLNLGIVLIIAGALLQHRRNKKIDAEAKLPRVDLNSPRHVRWLAGVATFGFLFLVASAFGSYQAYEYTDSVEFCGRICHNVMKPEYVAYKNSPHAKVECVQCHIGPGTTWFVRSKLSGSYQVYSVLAHKYPKPIATPVESLRPSKETCETCHWPKQFYSQKLQEKTYFLSDDKNTRGQLTMAMKVGGGDPEHGATEGIHYSMYLSHQVTYIAADRQRSIIPYIESRDQSGKVTIYRSTETPPTPAQIQKGERRVVDCIECHNRPSHQFHPPAEAVDQALAANRIDPALPEIKKTAVECLEKPYKTEDEALGAIKRDIEAFYKTSHPDASVGMSRQIAAAIAETQKIYSRNYFPEMKASWKAYPNHLGHKYSDGCFRCHDGKHVSDTGKVITNDCKTCHNIVGQTAGGVAQNNINGLEFKHPMEIGDAWKTTKCTDCHKAQQ